MKRHILTAVCVVAGLAVVGVVYSKSTLPQSFEPYQPTEQRHIHILSGMETHVRFGAFRRVEFHPVNAYAVIYVDDSFADKSFDAKENSCKVAAVALNDFGRAEYGTTVDVKHVDTGKWIGRYSWDSLKLY